MKDVSAGCKTLVLRKIPSLKLKLVKCYGGVDIFVSFVDKNVTTNSAVLPPPLPSTNTQNDIAPPLSMAAAKLIDKSRFRNAGLSKRN